jgi:cytochrome c5
MGRLELLALISFVLCVGACKETTIEDRTCPPGGTKLTYASFGKSFFETNCQTCHGQSAHDRNGAPGSYDFGSVDDVRVHKDRIFARAAADNTTMPPGPDDPPEADREKLAEWLSCGAP